MQITDSINVYLEDCFTFLQSLPEASVDLVLTDPPYNLKRFKGRSWNTGVDLQQLWVELKRVGKDSTVYLFLSRQPFTSHMVLSNLKEFRYELIWQKEQGTDFGNLNHKPLNCHENIVVFYKVPFLIVYNKQLAQGVPYTRLKRGANTKHDVNFDTVLSNNTVNIGTRSPLSVIKITRDTMGQGKSLYPAQKPVKLMEWLIASYSNVGSVVLDPFMGSGTTGVACYNLQRQFLGCDNSEIAFEIAVQRLTNLVKGVN